ncbi:MAG: carbohydrate kinase family protein [Rickettsiales bacterium]|nr:carbohydrate kinase family protein [Rickettsiales bacterium]
MAKILTSDTAYADIYIDGDALWPEFGSKIWPDPEKTKMNIDEDMRDQIISRLAHDYDIDCATFDGLCGRELGPDEQNQKRELLHDLLTTLENTPSKTQKKQNVIKISPGGSAMNTCATVAKALPGSHITMLTSVGQGPVGSKLKEKLGSVMDFQPDRDDLRTSMSFVFSHKGGSRHYAKFSGTTDKVTEETTHQARQDRYNAVFLSSSILDPAKMPSLYVPLQNQAIKDHAELYVTLPTNAEIANEHHDDVMGAIVNADVVMANDEEMQFMFDPGAHKDDPESYDYCLEKLSEQLKPGACAFVTHGKEGADVLLKGEHHLNGERHHIPLWRDDSKPFEDLGGAGDASYAGFLTGYIDGHDPVKAGHMGMAFARDCISRKQAQIEDPQHVYAETMADDRVGMPSDKARYETVQPAVDHAKVQAENHSRTG